MLPATKAVTAPATTTSIAESLPVEASVPKAEAKKEVSAKKEVLKSTALVTIDIDVQDYGPITNSANVKRFVEDYFADVPIMAKIAKCESRYRQYDSAGNVLRGLENNLDVGVMQVNEHYHLADSKKLGFDIHSIEGNVAYARYLYERQGTKPWMSSSPCWAKYTHTEIAQK